MKHFASLVTRFPILSLLLSLCLAAPFLIQLPRIQTVDNVDYFTIEDDPDVAFYQSIKETFGEDEFFVIAFSSPDLFTSPILRMIAAITQELETIPEVREVQSLANVDYIHGEEEYFEVRPFLERIPEDAPGLGTLREQALGNPLYVGNLISADGETTALVVFPNRTRQGMGAFARGSLSRPRRCSPDTKSSSAGFIWPAGP